MAEHRIYRSIAIAVDNSEHARAAEELGVFLASRLGASVTGCHIYSGHLHRLRFQALEEYLPEQYQKDEVLEYQRTIHSVLIERGLEIISLEYMKRLREACAGKKIPFQEHVVDGKNADRLIEVSSSHDLTLLGAQGVGRVSGSRGLGGTARRVVRGARHDVLVTRERRTPGRILIGMDGSDPSFAALDRGIALARVLGAEVRVAASYNPVLHRTVFGLLSRVLSEEAGKVFKFTEQEELHNTIIDRSLSDLYRGHLERGGEIAAGQGVPVSLAVLEGQAWHALCQEAVDWNADLILVGRHGMHRGTCGEIGTTAERIVEETDRPVLVVGGERSVVALSTPPPVPDAEAASLRWTEEARKRIERVPSFARPMAMLAIERYARENGIETITPEVMDRAREKHGL